MSAHAKHTSMPAAVSLPTADHTRVCVCVHLMQVMPPEVAVVRLLRWVSDRKAAVQLALQHAELAGQLLATHNKCVGGGAGCARI